MAVAKPMSRVQAGLAPALARVSSIDIVRGAVMVLMAIDHVRVYAGVPAGGPTPGLFVTRWVTHFCAPAFVFLAGTGAFLHQRSPAGRESLAGFLVSRGALLVLLEPTLIRFFWTFSLDYSTFILAGVIWMLGWCMILLAALVRFPPTTVAVIGFVMVVGQQLFGRLPGLLPQAARQPIAYVWNFIYPSGESGWPLVSILYTIVPWIGVMALGYAFGAIAARDAAARRRWCLRVGLFTTLLFLVMAGAMVVLQPAENGPPIWIRILNQQKYPASQLFLLMTLGPTMAAIALVEGARGWPARVLETFGRVPMFYYLLHIPLIHLAALVVHTARSGYVDPAWFATAPYVSVPPNARWSLPLLYLVFAIVVALLYWPCRWFAALKSRRRDPWLRFL
jgi:uncharacterized membrane protein